MPGFAESDFEEAVLSYFEDVGWTVAYGPAIGPNGASPERATYAEPLLLGRLAEAIRRLNPQLDDDAVDRVVATVKRAESGDVVRENFRWHHALVQGVPIEVRGADGQFRNDRARLIDLRDPGRNDYLVVNQVAMEEVTGKARADVVPFINGIPIAVVELKDPTEDKATVDTAFDKLQNYKALVPSLIAPAVFLVVADGVTAALGSITADMDWFSRWRTVSDEEPEPPAIPQIRTLIHGAFDPARVLELIEFHVDWGEHATGLVKRIATYTQYWAVKKAAASVKVASAPGGNRRAGVIEHGQGSGKSLALLLAANMLMRDPETQNPTIIALSDRNALDDQLFDLEFGPSKILPETPVQAGSRADLRAMLNRASGGIIVTTIHKFGYPPERPPQPLVVSERRNIFVLADEAHRSQYGLLDGLAAQMREALPDATFVGFTGTPIEEADRSTEAVFGPVISHYSPRQSVEDGTTVPMYYQSRIAKVRLSAEAEETLDAALADITEDIPEEEQRRAVAQFKRIEAILASDPVIDRIVDDILDHWETRREQLHGKAMIVAVSREACVKIYDRIAAHHPEWVDEDDRKGRVKVAYTGSNDDKPHIRKHVRTPQALRLVKQRAQDPRDEIEIIIVTDLWLTGFNSKSLHTMYLAKLMRGHGLFQAVTRTNRTFRDKPAGLIVSYVPVLDALNEAIARYSKPTDAAIETSLDAALNGLLEKIDILEGVLEGSHWHDLPAATHAERLERLSTVANFLQAHEDRAERFLAQSLALLRLFAIVGTSDEAEVHRENVAFYGGVRGMLAKLRGGEPLGPRNRRDIDTAIGALVAGAIEADEVIDVYTAAGIDNPDISLLSDDVLARLAEGKRPRLQFEILRKILADEIRSIGRRNSTRSIQLSAALEAVLRRYQNRSLSDAEVIAQLVALAKELRREDARAAGLGLSQSEVAFYDAVVQNESAVMELGDEALKRIAKKLVVAIRNSATLDWRDRESVKSELRMKIRSLLDREGYPPDQQESAVDLVITQAERYTQVVLAL